MYNMYLLIFLQTIMFFVCTLVVGCVGGRPMILAGGRLLVSTVWGELASMDSPVSEEDGE